jgi:hypothetical protein
MNQILKEMCNNKTDNLLARNFREASGRSAFNTATEQATAEDINLMTVIKEPTGFYYFTWI